MIKNPCKCKRYKHNEQHIVSQHTTTTHVCRNRSSFVVRGSWRQCSFHRILCSIYWMQSLWQLRQQTQSTNARQYQQSHWKPSGTGHAFYTHCFTHRKPRTSTLQKRSQSFTRIRHCVFNVVWRLFCGRCHRVGTTKTSCCQNTTPLFSRYREVQKQCRFHPRHIVVFFCIFCILCIFWNIVFRVFNSNRYLLLLYLIISYLKK